jgi:hypothetical protein
MSEDVQQISLFRFYDVLQARVPSIAYAFHTPNGGVRARQTAARLKAMGTRMGVPDVLIPVKSPDGRYNGLAIELKYGKNKPTAAQMAWIQFLHTQDWSAYVVYDWTHAAALTCQYFGIAPDEYGLSIYME